jgi:hypothetical protein
LGTEANPIVIEDDPAPLGSESNPIVIHVEGDHSYSKVEQMSSDDTSDTELITESWWKQFLDETCDISSARGIAGCSTSDLVPTPLPVCKYPEESQASGQLSADSPYLDGQALETAEYYHVEHGSSDKDEQGRDGESSTMPSSSIPSAIAHQNGTENQHEQVDASKVKEHAEISIVIEALNPTDPAGSKKRKTLHDEGSIVRRSDRLIKRAMR